ncbi:MAG: precorrin-3B C(17)-methyltransferase [Methanosarcinaceae archaeon]|nr:precorrin-3B C(17)-methyltransferase [Methanosarcinaceae archaeon]
MEGLLLQLRNNDKKVVTENEAENIANEKTKGKGKLYIVGIGPGSVEHLTVKAKDVILNADYVVGNDTYLDQIESLLTNQEIYRSTMGKEVDRAKEAVRLAENYVTVMVSGGDANVYGMAGIVLEVAEKNEISVEVEVLPGVTAMLASASVLGAPVVIDSATISLSDLLTPWEVIEKRLKLATEAGFIISLYNPKSRQRKSNFENAIEIIKKYRDGSVPVGLVKNALRPEGQEYIVTTLDEVLEYNDWVDMRTAIIICSEDSRVWESEFGSKIITPRGYHKKYEY